jgi:hypothetical protein
MEKPRLASRNRFGKGIPIIYPLINLSNFRKFIIVLDNTLVRFIGFKCPENSIRNIKFIVTMDTNKMAFSQIVTHVVESDDVT